MMRRRIVVLLALLVAGCGVAPTPTPTTPTIYEIVAGPADGDSLQADAAAPGFSWQLPDGARRALADEAGHPLIINFWATWCAPCRDEMPLLETAYNEHKADGLLVLGVNVKEDASLVAQYANEMGLTFPLLRDSGARLSLAYSLMGLPMSVFVRRDGTVQARQIGLLDRDTLDKQLGPQLQQP